MRRTRPRWRQGIARSQVSWRLASWRVAAVARAASASSSPTVERVPCLAVADRAHRRQRRRAGRRARASAAPRRRNQRRAWRRSARRCVGAARRGRPARARRAAAFAPPARCARSRAAVPLSRCTSSARWMRWLSRGAMRAALAGSTAASSACRAGQPARAARASSSLAHLEVGFGEGVEAVEQRLEVEHRAADQDRQRTARADRRDRRARVGDEARRRIALARLDDVDQVVRHGGALGARSAWRCRCPCRGRRGPSRR